jgi:mxaJ protein
MTLGIRGRNWWWRPIWFGCLLGAAGWAAEPERVLRVALGADGLPGEAGEECFENRIAAVLAREMRVRLEPVRGDPGRRSPAALVAEGRADFALGVPVGSPGLITTRSYYASTYMFVFRRGAWPIESFDDPLLRILRVGVQLTGRGLAEAPPAHALFARGCIENVRGYSAATRTDTVQTVDAVRAVAAGEIDVAVAWGPVAGQLARRQSVTLEFAPVSPERDGPDRSFIVRVAIGVPRTRPELRREIDDVLRRCQGEIEAILDEAGVPRVPGDGGFLRWWTASGPL